VGRTHARIRLEVDGRVSVDTAAFVTVFLAAFAIPELIVMASKPSVRLLNIAL
jgi:hypothetical protein